MDHRLKLVLVELTALYPNWKNVVGLQGVRVGFSLACNMCSLLLRFVKVSVLDIVCLEGILEEVASLVEE